MRARFSDRAGGSAAPWLFGIARNTLLMSVRRGAIERRACQRLGLLERLDREPAAVTPRPAWADEADELLDALPPSQREAVRLRVLEELEYEQVAGALGTTPGDRAGPRPPRAVTPPRAPFATPRRPSDVRVRTSSRPELSEPRRRAPRSDRRRSRADAPRAGCGRRAGGVAGSPPAVVRARPAAPMARSATRTRSADRPSRSAVLVRGPGRRVAADALLSPDQVAEQPVERHAGAARHPSRPARPSRDGSSTTCVLQSRPATRAAWLANQWLNYGRAVGRRRQQSTAAAAPERGRYRLGVLRWRGGGDAEDHRPGVPGA